MEFIGTKFSLTLGTWRLNLVFNIEEVQDDAAPQPVLRPHHVIHAREHSKARSN
ncbi:MAG: hypothetical protein M3126_02495 [Candidatus Eremiobacteraeota bacterium]|nr:hypothetical protein [Candidatus Eremiobacteraeota bacterium]